MLNFGFGSVMGRVTSGVRVKIGCFQFGCRFGYGFGLFGSGFGSRVCFARSKYKTSVDFLMQNKMQTPVLLSNFVSYVENHFQTSINIRSDNGTKFIQGQCATLFGTKGIIQHKSVPKTPQQNGRIERKHRHLIDN